MTESHPDQPTQWLIEQMQALNGGRALWCCDENVLDALPETINWAVKPHIVSNRYDVAEGIRRAGLSCDFSDFDFSGVESETFDRVYYRVSKEKALVHHIINQAARLLRPGGQLLLSGHKNEGIKTYLKKAAQRLQGQSTAKSQKMGNSYAACLTRSETPSEPLDDQDYQTPRPIARPNGLTLYSKPGLFGWQKIDQGSEFLMMQARALLKEQPAPPKTLLDLGCGYGYLTLMTHDWPLERRLLTDNNAAALAMAERNCRENNLEAEVMAGDCGNTLNESFDWILCNPPFHQGFSVSGDLTRKFLNATHRLLAETGTALFVVNAFIPLERLAADWFAQVRLVANDGRFKVVALRKSD